MTLPITKHSFFVNRIEDLEHALRESFRIANSGRKGPVLIDITKDVTAATIDYKKGKPLPLQPNPKADEKEVAEIAEMINRAERPVIYFGGGVAASDAGDELNELLEIADIPATYTLMAAGILGYENKRNLGLIGDVYKRQKSYRSQSKILVSTLWLPRLPSNRCSRPLEASFFLRL